jgi:hypothetical protein
VKKYTIFYEEYNSNSNKYCDNHISFDAEDEIHAINQLLDSVKDQQDKVSCISKIVENKWIAPHRKEKQ